MITEAYTELQVINGVPTGLRSKKYREVPENGIPKRKAEKNTALDEAVITANTVAYDVNGVAIGNMASVASLANFKYITYTDAFKVATLADTVLTDVEKLMAIANNDVATREAVYKTTINWKGADNTVHVVQVESICEALEAGMTARAGIYGV